MAHVPLSASRFPTRSRDTIYALALLFLVADTLPTYFLGVPYSSVIGIVLGGVAVAASPPKISRQLLVIASCTTVFAGLILIAILSDVYVFTTVTSAISIPIVTIIGFEFARRIASSGGELLFYPALGGLAILAVCAVALSGVLPTLFPVVNSIGYEFGEMNVRPSITTDQNFQIAPILFSLLLPVTKRLRPYLDVILLSAMASIALIIQSRGSLVALIMVALTLLIQRDSAKFRALLFTGAVLVGFMLIWLSADFSAAIKDFQLRSAGGGAESLHDRVSFVSHLLTVFWNPHYFFPVGIGESLVAVGDIPHFTPLTALLEGGLPALVIVSTLLVYAFWKAVGSNGHVPRNLAAVAIGMIVMSFNVNMIPYKLFWVSIAMVWGYSSVDRARVSK